MATRRRPRRPRVYNGSGAPLFFNSDGALIGHGESRDADPDDPITKALLDKGDLILKEG